VYQWGITGLPVRTDLVDKPITRRADRWETALTDKIVLWPDSSRYDKHPAEIARIFNQILCNRQLPMSVLLDRPAGNDD
jgi:hypothetical protein